MPKGSGKMSAIIIIICGLSFAGKSILGRAIAEKLDCSEVDVDQTKLRLFGSGVKDTELSRAQWDCIYAEADSEIDRHTRSGRSVVDASRHFRKVERDRMRAIAYSLKTDLITIYVNTPETVVRDRWLENRKHQARRD
jgi:predicted kinase